MPANAQQNWIRKGSLVVLNASSGIDLSNMHFTFRITAQDLESPNNAVVRVYNLSEQTSRDIQNEYSRVVIQAGYENGNFGTVFDGTIAQIGRGRENNTDTYVDIMAHTTDLLYNFGTVNTNIAAGATPQTIADTIQRELAKFGASDKKGLTIPLSEGTGGVLPRGKVLYGLGRAYLRDLAKSTYTTWSINDNGQIEFVSLTGYSPGDIVEINSKTGMIGQPEATNAGVRVRTLLNPLLRVGQRVRINNADINQTKIEQQLFPDYSSIDFFATVTDDGVYRIMVVEHEGDTRGQSWYSDLVCLAVDTSTAPGFIQPYGGEN